MLVDLIGGVAVGGAVALLVAMAFRNVDRRVPSPQASALRDAIAGKAGPATLALAEAAMRECVAAQIGPHAPIRRMLLTTLVASAVASLSLLFVYIGASRGFLFQFTTDWTALALVIRQYAFSGFVSILLATFASFSLVGALAGVLARASPGALALLAVGDMGLRMVVFAGATAATHVAFALLFDSFGGSVSTAIGVVPETLAYAAGFRGLFSAHLYAALTSGFPLFLLLAIKVLVASPTLAAGWRRVVPGPATGEAPVRAAMLLMAAFLGLCAALATLLIDAGRLTGASG